MDFQSALSALPQRRAYAVETHNAGDLLTALAWLLYWPTEGTAPRTEIRGTIYRDERPNRDMPNVISGPWWMPERSFKGRENAAEVPRRIQRLDWTPTEAIREEFAHTDLDTVGQRIMVLRGETVEVAAYGGNTPPFERHTVEHNEG